jgi:hypothetical protein
MFLDQVMNEKRIAGCTYLNFVRVGNLCESVDYNL